VRDKAATVRIPINGRDFCIKEFVSSFISLTPENGQTEATAMSKRLTWVIDNASEFLSALSRRC
jgi:hypothetical protein